MEMKTSSFGVPAEPAYLAAQYLVPQYLKARNERVRGTVAWCTDTS